MIIGYMSYKGNCLSISDRLLQHCLKMGIGTIEFQCFTNIEMGIKDLFWMLHCSVRLFF